MNRIGIKDRVQYNITSQTLTYYCPQGRPSADGTVTLYDGRYDPDDTAHNPIVTGTATRTAISVTMNGDAGPDESDPRNIPVSGANMTSISSLLKVGALLTLTNASNESEVVEVAKWGSASIGALDPLAVTYASGATVQSAELTSPAIPTAWIQDDLNIDADFRAEWSYTVGGVTYRPRSYFDVVRELVDTSVRVVDVADAFPDVMRVLSKRERDGFIREAQREVDKLFRQRGYSRPDRLRGTEAYQSLVRDCVPWIMARSGRRPNGYPSTMDFIPVARDQWDQAAAQFLEGKLIVPLDQNDDDVNQAEEAEVMSTSLIH